MGFGNDKTISNISVSRFLYSINHKITALFIAVQWNIVIETWVSSEEMFDEDLINNDYQTLFVKESLYTI